MRSKNRISHLGTFVSLLIVCLGTQAQAQQPLPQYTVTNIGTLGGTQSSAYGIDNKRWVTGAANLAGDEYEHAFLLRGGVILDLGAMGGPNGSAGFPFKDNRGLIAGFGQTPSHDPLEENWNYFCTLSGILCQGTDLISLGFVWDHGVKTAMPTLGGNKSQATGANNRGQVVGFAETSNQDPTCIAPQILDYEAVIWSPGANQIKALPTYPGDSVGAALGINDSGQVVGASGNCAPISPGLALHALIWQNGVTTDLGNLGGVMSNVAYAINNQGQVVGVSDLPGDSTAHAFLWQSGTITDLGTLPGDVFSVAFSINNKGQIVGESCDPDFNCRAFLWQYGVMADLNTLIPPTSPLYLLSANDLNDSGEIVGQAFDQSTGAAPAFLSIPCDEKPVSKQGCDVQGEIGIARPKVVLPENIREQLRRRLGVEHFRTDDSQPTTVDFFREHLGSNFNSAASASSCSGLGTACSSGTQCCNHWCGAFTHRCCLPFHNMYCTNSSQCCSGACVANRCL